MKRGERFVRGLINVWEIPPKEAEAYIKALVDYCKYKEARGCNGCPFIRVDRRGGWCVYSQPSSWEGGGRIIKPPM